MIRMFNGIRHRQSDTFICPTGISKDWATETGKPPIILLNGTANFTLVNPGFPVCYHNIPLSFSVLSLDVINKLLHNEALNLLPHCDFTGHTTVLR